MILHPAILDKLSSKTSASIKTTFDIIPSKGTLEFSPGIFYLGEIPRGKTFEKGTFKEDSMLDDSAIAVKTDKGVVVITGCSHAGVCNICEYAKKITGQKLHAVIGGFHLFEEDKAAIEGTINYFKREAPDLLLPMHCVDFPTLTQFHRAFGCKKYSAGDVIEI